jgi:Predicted membrane protein
VANQKELSVTLPVNLVDELNIQDGEELEAVVKNKRLILQTTNDSDHRSRREFLWSLGVALLSGIIFLLYFCVKDQRQVPLSGGYSISSAIIIFGVVLGMVLFSAFFIKARQKSDNRTLKNIYWRNFPTIILAVGLILALSLLGIFWVFELIFPDISFDPVTSSLFVLIFCFFINYMMIQAAGIISPFALTTVFTIVIISGVIISMVTNGNRHWWEYNLSFLGTDLAHNAWQFNLTLIISALIMIVLVDYLFVSLGPNYRSWRLLILRGLLTLTAVCLGSIGIFTNNQRFHFIHDQIASSLAYLVLAMIIGIKWMLPQISREFQVFSYVMGIILVAVSLAFKPIDYLSLTGFEMLSFFAVFGWILLLFQNLQFLAEPTQQKVIVRISTKH